MNVSRLHAKIVFNFSSRFFELIVIGKNGKLLMINCSPVPFKCNTVHHTNSTVWHPNSKLTIFCVSVPNQTDKLIQHQVAV